MADKDFIVKNGINVNGTFLYTGGVLSLGNSTVNVTANSTLISVGTGSVINTTVHYVGNSTQNVVVTLTGITVSNSGGALVLGPQGITLGSNVQLFQNEIVSPLVTTANGTVDLNLNTGNTAGPSIGLNSAGSMNLWGNSTIKVANADGGGFVILKSKVQTVAYSANVQWDLANGNIGVLTLTANTVMPAPLNMSPGNYILHVLQDVTGGRQITSWNPVFKWTSASAPVLSTGASARDIISFTSDGTNMYGSYIPDVR